jgi:hypothetical protein
MHTAELFVNGIFLRLNCFQKAEKFPNNDQILAELIQMRGNMNLDNSVLNFI